jgi:cytochrome c oxidase subunit 2
LLGLGTLSLCGCEKARSALAPVTSEAAGIAHTWWLFFAICTAVYLIVVALVIGAWLKHRAQALSAPPAPLTIEPKAEHRTHRLVTWAAVVTVIILIGLLTADLWFQHGIGPRGGTPLTVRLTGHQWWWAAEYQNPDASEVFETANELHVPIGRPIRLLLESNDVIHSFWVPRIHGKRDLVPGHPASLSFQIDQPGRYEGNCAEFCGFQHAHMEITVVAEAPEHFEAWAQVQRSQAPEPTNDLQRRGRDLFEHSTCAMCHTVQGTTAHSRVGPVLTHFASHRELGAGAVPNTRDHLARWITDPQTVKPGVRMPPIALSTPDLEAMLAYLETLK